MIKEIFLHEKELGTFCGKRINKGSEFYMILQYSTFFFNFGFMLMLQPHLQPTLSPRHRQSTLVALLCSRATLKVTPSR
jgi:hypothetical protein